MLNFYCQQHFQTRHTPLILRRVKVIKKQVSILVHCGLKKFSFILECDSDYRINTI